MSRNSRIINIIKICKICKNKFHPFSKRIKTRNLSIFCSRKCYGKSRIGIPAWNKGKKFRLGTWNHHWKGGITIHQGYKMIKKPNHPMARKNGYIMEHRFIISQHIKRLLKPSEEIHHINGNRSDNRISNLKLLSKEEHKKFHMKERWIKGNPIHKISIAR